MEVPVDLLPMVAVVAVFVQFIRRLGIPGGYLPFISMGIAAIFVAFTNPASIMQLVMGAIAVGAAAAGTASAVKSMGALKPK